MYQVKVAFSKLIAFAVHLGHTRKNTLLFSAWFVYKFSSDFAFISLVKFVQLFNLSMLFITAAVGSHSPIWFVNLDQSMDLFVRFCAYNCGEFSVTTGWVGGLASNLWSIYKGYLKMLTLPGFIKTSKHERISRIFEEFVLARYTWPRCIFFSNVHDAVSACKDALYGRIPAIGIVDTNTLSLAATSPVPGSDDSFRTITFNNDLVSNIVLIRKFINVANWLFFNREPLRFADFQSWLDDRFPHFRKYSKDFFYSNFGDKTFILNKSLDVLGSYGSSRKGFKDAMNVFGPNFLTRFYLNRLYLSFRVRNLLLIKINVATLADIDFNMGFFKKRFMSFSSLKLNFFVKYKGRYIFLQRYRFVNSFLKRFLKREWHHLQNRGKKGRFYRILLRIITLFVFQSFRQFKFVRKWTFIFYLSFSNFLSQILSDVFFFLRPKSSILLHSFYLTSKSFRFWKEFSYNSSVNSFLQQKALFIDMSRFVFIQISKFKVLAKISGREKNKFYLHKWSFSSSVSKYYFHWNLPYYRRTFFQRPKLIRSFFYFSLVAFDSLTNLNFFSYYSYLRYFSKNRPFFFKPSYKNHFAIAGSSKFRMLGTESLKSFHNTIFTKKYFWY